MAESPFQISPDEVKNFLLASIVIAAGLIAFDRIYEPLHMLKYVLLAPLLLLMREIGHRVTAYYMTSYVDLEFSKTGGIMSLAAAMFAVLLNLPIILLFPVYSEFRNTQYESWGYEIDVIWAKREYWFASVGTICVMMLWPVFFYLGWNDLATAVGLFTFFQMIPFRKNSITEGATDGAYILLHSGFVWVMLLGLSVVLAALPL
jgi:hypothetical protein